MGVCVSKSGASHRRLLPQTNGQIHTHQAQSFSEGGAQTCGADRTVHSGGPGSEAATYVTPGCQLPQPLPVDCNGIHRFGCRDGCRGWLRD